MIANVNGKYVRVLRENGCLVRTILCSSEVDCAYVNGDQVNVQLANGHSEIFKLDGSLVRRF